MTETFDPKLGGMTLLFANNSSVSRTALNKLLFFSDVTHLMRTGRPISDRRYLRLPFGPVPKDIDTIRNALIGWGFLVEKVEPGPIHYRYDYLTQTGAVDLSKVRASFDALELATIDNICDRLKRFSPTALSEISHRYEPWKSTAPGEYLDLNKAVSDPGLQIWLTQTGVTITPGSG